MVQPARNGETRFNQEKMCKIVVVLPLTFLKNGSFIMKHGRTWWFKHEQMNNFNLTNANRT